MNSTFRTLSANAIDGVQSIPNYIGNGKATNASTKGYVVYQETDAVTFTDAGDLVNLTNHGLQNGNTVSFTVITTTTGISINTLYYVVSATTSTFQVASTLGGSALALTTNGSGTLVRFIPKTGASAGSPALTFTTSSSSPLSGDNSFLYTKSAANLMGQGVSYDFTINSSDQAKVLQVSAEIAVASGTFVAGSTSTDSDVTIWIYDTTNLTVTQLSNYKIFSNSSLSNTFQGTFQTASNSTSYRLIFHVGSTSASAYVLKLDQISVSPAIGAAAIAGAIPVTVQKFLSGSGTYTTPPNVKYIRVKMVGGGGGGGGYSTAGSNGTSTTFGSSLLTAAFGSGGGGSTTAQGGAGGVATVNSPAVIILAMTGGSGTGGTNSNITSGGSGGNSIFGGAGGGGGDTNIGQTAATNSGSGGGGGGAQSGGTSTAGGGAGAGVDAIITAPLATYAYSVGTGGNGASGTMSGGNGAAGQIIVEEYYVGSSADDGRVVAAAYRSSSTLTTASATTVKPLTKMFDTHAAFNTTTGLFTCPVAGIYKVSLTSIENNVGVINEVVLYKNGSAAQTFGYSTAANGLINGSTVTVNCNSGDTLGVVQEGTAGMFGISASRGALFTFERLSGPSAIAASETVAASYWLSANFTTSTTIPINFDSKEFDTHGAVTTSATAWKFTAPVSGIYSVSTDLYTAGNQGYMMHKNGSAYKGMAVAYSTGTVHANNTTLIKLIAGDYIDIRTDAGSVTQVGGTLAAINASKISVLKVGN